MNQPVKKMAIIGPESTGKSVLCQYLSKHYNTEWVPEFARYYLDELDRPYEQHDLLNIAKGQLAWEDNKAKFANGYLFCDTTLIVIKIWSHYKYGSTHQWIEKELKARHYNFYLLGNIDIPWKPDPQREHANMRPFFFDLYKKYLDDHSLPYSIVSGIGDERNNRAVDAIENWERHY